MDCLNREYSLKNPDTPYLYDQLLTWSAHFGKILLDQVPIRKGMQVLDIGAGTGYLSLELAHMLGPSSRVTGLDNWEQALEHARTKAARAGLQNLQFVSGDAAQIPFEEGSYDLIVSNLGINNFQDPAAALRESFRVLKKMGKICVTTNLEGHFREFYQTFESTLKEAGLKEQLPLLKAEEEKRGTDESIRDLFEQAGFSITKLIRGRFQLRFVDGTAFLNHLLIVMGFLPDWKKIVPPDIQPAFFQRLEANLNEQAKWDGELKMTVPSLYVEAIK